MAYNTGFDLFTYLLAKQNASGGGSGANFQSLTINSDGIVSVVDADGINHTLIPVYDNNGAINTITYDGKNIEIKYDNEGNLIKIGNSNIDVSIYPPIITNIGYTVTFKVDGNDYYVASCEAGETISTPPDPIKTGYYLSSWQLNGVDVSFPYTPSADVELTGVFSVPEQREYIKSTGAYIDTDIMTDIDDRYEIEFEVVSSSSRFDTFCYNGDRTYEDGSGIYFFKDNNNNFDAYIGGSIVYFNTSWSAGSYKITCVNKTMSLYRGDTLINSRTSTGTTQSTYAWRLLNGGDLYLNRYCTFNVKSIKVYDKTTDELKHNIVAGYKGAIGGMWDLVTSKFYQPSDSNFEISAT